jgi:hypothetical protein
MRVLPQALEIIFEVQRKKRNGSMGGRREAPVCFYFGNAQCFKQIVMGQSKRFL